MLLKKIVLFIVFISLFFLKGWAQNIITVDATKVDTSILSGHLKMGNAGPLNREILINNRYLTIDGKPVLPVMGEVHFTRLPREKWEDVVLKMKACGVNIIATYIFWVHHEETEGKWEWSGNKDFRAFAQLCQKHGLYVYPRIGPWCHGEVRNGGFPDWLMLKENIKTRSNDPQYQGYADKLYQQIGEQMRGLLYKDGGPIIGVQLENEYGRGKGGEAHILWLKKEAQKYGIDVPMYTVTGWGNGSVPANEVVPLWGAYPDEPWGNNLRRTTTCTDFEFSAYRNNDKIGNGLSNKNDANVDKNLYPFLTCEMGLGIENTDHRRLVIGNLDGYGLIQAKLGSGSNLIGYYMFAGGSNPQGIYSSLEENREEVGAYNTNPAVSYDFQAAIKESGELNAPYFEVKKLHYFLNEFGDQLATMQPIIATTGNDMQLSVRANNDAAYLFGMNYCRHNIKPEIKSVQFKVALKNETVLLPSKPINIADSSTFIWPINFKMDNTVLKYATAQPLCKLVGKRFNTWVFIQDLNMLPEFCFDVKNIKKITSNKGIVLNKDGKIIISELKPGFDCELTITLQNGSFQKVIILSKQEARRVWLLKDGDRKRFFISEANMYLNQQTLHIFGKNNVMDIKVFGNDEIFKTIADAKFKPTDNGLFKTYQFAQAKKNIIVDYQQTSALGDAKWLECNSSEPITKKNELMHRFFVKRFSLIDAANIRSAKLFIASEMPFKVQVNNIWVNQPMPYGRLNELDLTGYLKIGTNQLMLDYIFTEGKKDVAAKLVIDYFNNNEATINTDSTWLTKDQYMIPSFLTKETGFKIPIVLNQKPNINLDEFNATTYKLILPKTDDVKDLNNFFINIKYLGDWAKLYANGKLISDDFNANIPFNIGLNRLPKTTLRNVVEFKITSLQKDKKVYFDQSVPDSDKYKAAIISLEAIPEYRFDLNLK